MTDRHPRTIPVSLIELECLWAIHAKGPVWDGDVPSKSARDDLLDKGLVAKVCVKGEDGFQACTYLGHDLLRRFYEEISPRDADVKASKQVLPRKQHARGTRA